MRTQTARRVGFLATWLFWTWSAPAQNPLDDLSADQFTVAVGSGARAYGMAGAFIAVADDATASSWNPAGLAVLEKPEGSLVWKASSSRLDASPYVLNARGLDGNGLPYGLVSTSTGGVFRNSAQAIDFASLSFPLRLGSTKLVPQVSYQRAIDLNQATRTVVARASSSSLRYDRGDFSQSTDQPEETYTFDSVGSADLWTASLGLRVTPSVYLGLAANLWRGKADASAHYQASLARQTQPLPAADDCGQCAYAITRGFEARFDGLNLNFGALVKPVKRLSIGVVYKTPFDLDLDLNATQSVVTTEPSEARLPASLSQVVRRDAIRWPRTVGVGFAYTATDRLTFSFDATATRWSSVTADTTTTTRTQAPGTGAVVVTEASASGQWPYPYDPGRATGPGNQEQADSYQYRLGAEYTIPTGKLVWVVRGGGFYDQVLVRTADGRNTHYSGGAAGLGVSWSRLSLDLAYLLTRFGSKRDDYVGTVPGFTSWEHRADREDKVSTQRFYASLIVRFGD